jgi:hypothetical protein
MGTLHVQKCCEIILLISNYVHQCDKVLQKLMWVWQYLFFLACLERDLQNCEFS